jgi:hypothetical protein
VRGYKQTKLGQDTGKCTRYYALDLLEHARVLGNAHTDQFVRSPVLVEDIVGVLAKLFHVGADEHLAELDKIAVFFVVDLNDTPRI